MNVNSRGHNLDTRFRHFFLEIKHPPGLKNPVGDIYPAKYFSSRYKTHKLSYRLFRADQLTHLVEPCIGPAYTNKLEHAVELLLAESTIAKPVTIG